MSGIVGELWTIHSQSELFLTVEFNLAANNDDKTNKDPTSTKVSYGMISRWS